MNFFVIIGYCFELHLTLYRQPCEVSVNNGAVYAKYAFQLRYITTTCDVSEGTIDSDSNTGAII